MELKRAPDSKDDDNDCNEDERLSRRYNCDARQSADDELLCGLGKWRPAYLQWLANHYAYSLAFILIGIVQGMSWTYFNGIVTTVEKAFHVDSSTMGIIMAGNDVSQIFCGLVLTYVASRGNKPFWMAVGILIGASACFIYASTQLFWTEAADAQDFVLHQHSNETSTLPSSFCSKLTARSDISNSSLAHGDCIDVKNRSNFLAVAWLFLGQFVSGIGGTTTYALGFAYMDDNIKKKNSPIYIGLTQSMRSLGPTLGYLLASFCLSIHIVPNEAPDYESSDPRWLGAWWLGFMIIGILQTLFAFPILLFPAEMPSATQTKSQTNSVPPKAAQVQQKATLKEFLPTMKRIAHNPIIAGCMVAFSFLVFAIVGISTFLPKYLEARFAQTASRANILTGLSGQMMIALGVFTGGVVMWKFKPRAVYVAAWTVAVDFTYAMGFLAVMNLDCNDIALEGVSFNKGRAEIVSSCSEACNCAMTFDPVCVEWQNFLSPCMAGCTVANTTIVQNTTKNIFYNCECGPSPVSSAYSGFCKEAKGTCSNLWIYMGIVGFVQMIFTSTRVGCTMIILRSVIKEDKGVAITLITVATSIFGYIPSPIVYGAVVDSTCLLWETSSCGHRGNCWLYDVEAFSYWFHGLTVSFVLVAVMADVFIMTKCTTLRLYDDEHDSLETEDAAAMREAMMVTRTNSLTDGL